MMRQIKTAENGAIIRMTSRDAFELMEGLNMMRDAAGQMCFLLEAMQNRMAGENREAVPDWIRGGHEMCMWPLGRIQSCYEAHCDEITQLKVRFGDRA